MKYAIPTFTSKKALKEAIESGQDIYFEDPAIVRPRSMHVSELSEGESLTFVGPGPYDRKWYGVVKRKDGKLRVY